MGLKCCSNHRARLILYLGSQLGLTEDIGDDPFRAGQLSRAEQLGDSGTTVNGKFDPSWHKEFKNEIHGLILVRKCPQNLLTSYS